MIHFHIYHYWKYDNGDKSIPPELRGLTGTGQNKNKKNLPWSLTLVVPFFVVRMPEIFFKYVSFSQRIEKQINIHVRYSAFVHGKTEITIRKIP